MSQRFMTNYIFVFIKKVCKQFLSKMNVIYHFNFMMQRCVFTFIFINCRFFSRDFAERFKLVQSCCGKNVTIFLFYFFNLIFILLFFSQADQEGQFQ